MYQFHKVKNNIEDVPMKFSEKYLTLLNNSKLYQDCDDDDDDDDDYNFDQYKVEEYKFDSELIAIEMYELYQKRKEEKLKRNALEKSLAKNVQSTTVQDNWRMACSKFLPDETNSKTTMLYNMISGQILQPQPLNNSYSPLTGTNQSASTAYENCDSSNNKNTVLDHFKNNNALVNPKEFENDDSSPFDNVELQTLDDIKELNKVFGALNLSKEKNASKSMVPRNSPNQTIEQQTTNTNTNTIPVNNVVTLSSAPPSISYQSFVPNTIYSSQINTNSYDNQPNSSYTNYKTNSQFENHMLIYNNNNCVGAQYSPLYQSPTHLRQNNTSMSGNIVFGNPYYNNAASNLYNYNNQTASYPIFNNLNNAAPDVQRSFLEKKDFQYQNNIAASSRSKSVSDLSQRLSEGESNNQNNMDTLKDRSKTPPSLPGKFNMGIENDQINMKIQKQNHHQNQGKLIQTDPYESLNKGQKTFVDHLCQMGFKRDRISRAVKHINIDDDKKIFEYLLALQQLEDQGYDCYEAEIALHFNNYDKREAENFLLTLKQICDLGFDKEKSIKALFKTNNNREKAIESLLKMHH